jgi:hypothetical protein
MISRSDSVQDAIRRWERSGLVDTDTADALRDEARLHEEQSSGRLAQYLLATAGAIVLVIAGGVFIDWAWPILGDGARTGLLAALGVGVIAGGIHLESRTTWVPAALLMQTGGIGLILSAYIYSEQAWEPTSTLGVIVGLVSLTAPIVLCGRAMKRDVVMPAVNMTASLVFLAIFLDRSTPLSGDDVVWALDAVLASAIVVLTLILRRDPDGETHPWALNAFVAAMGGGFILVAISAFETLDLSDNGWLAVDAWLALCAGITLWGMHRAPGGLRKEWFERALATQLFAWIWLGGATVEVTFDGPSEAFVLLVSGMAIAAFVHADRHHLQQLMGMATLAFVIPIWFWAIDRGGALGGVLALLGTAGLLFWASGRRNRLGGVPADDGAA